MAGKGSPEWRLTVIEAVLGSGNIRAACEQHGMDPTTFYKLKRRIAGLPRDRQLAALQDRPRRWKSHGQQTTEQERRAIKLLVVKHPALGCNQIQAMLAKKGIKRSATTVQKIMAEEDLGTEHKRWLALDTINAKLSAEQVAFVARFNPRIRCRRFLDNLPRATIDLDWFDLGSVPGLGSLVMIAAVDQDTSLAFGSIRKGVSEANVVWLFDKRIAPAFKKGLVGKTVTVPKIAMLGDRFDAALRRTSLARFSRRANEGCSEFMDAFRREVLAGFVEEHAKSDVYDEIKTLQRKFREWLKQYNSTALDGYPHFGRSPVDMLKVMQSNRSAAVKRT